MFPPQSLYARYEDAGGAQVPADGRHLRPLRADHPPGHANRSQKSRPVLVLGVDAPGAGNAEHHDMAVTQGYYDRCPSG